MEVLNFLGSLNCTSEMNFLKYTNKIYRATRGDP